MRRFLLLLPLLCPLAARAQSAAFTPDFSKPDAATFIAPYAQNGGVAAPVRVEAVKGALQMTATAGGSLGVKFAVPPFDVDQLTRLSFDYTTSPDAKVNLFFRVNGHYYAVLFTGPKRVRAGTPIITDAYATKASGHVEIPLRAALRALLPNEANLRCDEMLAGNWDNEGYLLAGIGGNGPGASWTVSNFKLDRPTAKATFGAARFEGQELIIPAQNLDALSFKNIAIKTDAGRFPATYDALRGAFTVDGADIAAASALLRDAQSITFQLRGEGNGDTPLTQGSATFHTSNLPAPPLPQLQLANSQGAAPNVDFESPSAPFGMDKTPNTVFERDDQNPYSGQWSARFTNPRTASPFEVNAIGAPVDVALNPVLTFAYRCDDRLRLDLNLAWNNQPYSIHFTDSDNPNPRLGDLNATRDGAWHLATFNLLDAMKKAQPNATDFKITTLTWNDLGWPGNVKGLKWWLDDLKWAHNVGPALDASAALHDATGTQAVSFSLDQNPATRVGESPQGGAKLSINLAGKTGLWWLHLRAQNGAGKWSETAHFPVWCG